MLRCPETSFHPTPAPSPSPSLSPSSGLVRQSGHCFGVASVSSQHQITTPCADKGAASSASANKWKASLSSSTASRYAKLHSAARSSPANSHHPHPSASLSLRPLIFVDQELHSSRSIICYGIPSVCLLIRMSIKLLIIRRMQKIIGPSLFGPSVAVAVANGIWAQRPLRYNKRVAFCMGSLMTNSKIRSFPSAAASGIQLSQGTQKQRKWTQSADNPVAYAFS